MSIVYNKGFIYNGMTFFITYVFRSKHGILSTCYPASQLVDYSGPLCCAANGWKEMRIDLQQILVNAPLAA